MTKDEFNRISKKAGIAWGKAEAVGAMYIKYGGVTKEQYDAAYAESDAAEVEYQNARREMGMTYVQQQKGS